ncbi:hypothetical protein QL285_009182 [Trifolium repens]|nr:hypothetical protein QL285_009182 [Trifolium repens]
MGVVKKKWDLEQNNKTLPRLFVTLAQRVKVLAPASCSVAAACVFCPSSQFSNLGFWGFKYFSWGVIIGIGAGRSSIGPCHESFQLFPKYYRPFGSGLFTLKPSRFEPDQLSIVYGSQGIMV